MKYRKMREQEALLRFRELLETPQPHPESAYKAAVRALCCVLLWHGCDRLVEDFEKIEKRAE
jgi:hypothetical protein